MASENRLKLRPGLSVKALDGSSQDSTPHVGRMFDAPQAVPKAARMALETVKLLIHTEKSVKTNEPLKQKQTISPKKVTEKIVKKLCFCLRSHLFRYREKKKRYIEILSHQSSRLRVLTCLKSTRSRNSPCMECLSCSPGLGQGTRRPAAPGPTFASKDALSIMGFQLVTVSLKHSVNSGC